MNLNIMNEFGEESTKDWPAEKAARASIFISNNEINPDHGWLYAGGDGFIRLVLPAHPGC